mmetsp:Transcript_69302/g.103100  ORF Transcript_69302/g.103100 Transcript_69302/m.103100 type:complete len:81 (+) Transcript_69302:127-369(+)
MVNYCNTQAEFDEVMEKSKTQLVVVDFTASWCPPCKMIAPFFAELAEKYPDAIFVKVDVDEGEDLAACKFSFCSTRRYVL